MVQRMCVRVFMFRQIAACAHTSVMRHACSVCNAQRNYDIAAAIPTVSKLARRTLSADSPSTNVACCLFMPRNGAKAPLTAWHVHALSLANFLVLALQPHVVGFSRAPLHFYYFFNIFYSLRISTIYISCTRCLLLLLPQQYSFMLLCCGVFVFLHWLRNMKTLCNTDCSRCTCVCASGLLVLRSQLLTSIN